jgi:hypothetical protein
MDPINIPPMLAYIPYMDPMGIYIYRIPGKCMDIPVPEKKSSAWLGNP